MRKIYNIIYYILIFVLILIITNIWLSYFVKNKIILQLISITLSSITIVYIYKKNIKKHLNENITKQDKLLYEQFKNFLQYSNIENSLKLFIDILDNKNLKINKNHNSLISTQDNSIYILFLKDDILNKKDYLEIIQKYINKYSNIIIYCFEVCDFDKSDYFVTKNITVLPIYEIFLINKAKIQSLLNFKILTQNPKKSLNIQKVINNITTTSKWKTYLFYGFTILILNRFTSNKLYLSIFATIFLILSIICILKKLLSNKLK